LAYEIINLLTYLQNTTRNLSSHIDPQTHSGSAVNNRVTLTFDLLISGSTHAEGLLCN